MNQKVEEETNRTTAEPVVPVHASRDNPDEEVTLETVEIVEDVVIDDPKDIEDVIRDDDDPRAEIYKRHTQKRETEIREGLAYTGQVDEEIEEEPAEELEKVDSTTIIAEDDELTATPSDAEETVEVNVYGDVHSVPKARVDKMPGNTDDERLQAYQKHLAVEKGMEQNAHVRSELESRNAALDERERRIAEQEAAVPALDQQKSQTSPDRSTPSDDQNLEDMARQYQEAVYDNEDDAPLILAQMVRTAANSGEKFDEDSFRQQVKNEVLLDQRQSKIVKASGALIDAHPELNSKDHRFDPRMFTAIDDETNVVERQHPEWEPEQVVQEAFNRIQKWKGGHQTETMTDKQKEKQTRARPKAGSKRYTPPPPPPRPTNSDYVASLRKTRGQE